MGKSRVLSGEDFRKSKAQRQTVGSSESMNSREAESRGISQWNEENGDEDDDDYDFPGY